TIFPLSRDRDLYILLRNSGDEEILRLMLAKGTVELSSEVIPAVFSKEIAGKMQIEKLNGKKLEAISLVRTYAAAEYLLEKGLDPNLEEAGNVPLTVAENAEVARALIAHGADINAEVKSWCGYCEKDGILGRVKNRAVAELLIASGLDPKKKSVRGTTYLHNEKLRKDVAEMLLEYGLSPNERDAFGKTPLFYSGYETATVQFLISRGADPAIKDNDGNTPLHHSVFSIEAAELMVANGLSVTEKNKNGDTPLHLVSDARCAEFLIEHGADVNSRNNLGQTPLLQFNVFKHREVLEVLLKHGADRNAVDNGGHQIPAELLSGVRATAESVLTPPLVSGTSEAAEQNATKIYTSPVEFLEWIKAGGDVLAEFPKALMEKKINSYKLQILYLFYYGLGISEPDPPQEIDARNYKLGLELILMFLEKGGNPNQVTFTGRSLLMMFPYPEAIGMLLKAGADPMLKDITGKSAVFYAARKHNNLEGIKLLVAEAEKQGQRISDLLDNSGNNLMMNSNNEYLDYFVQNGLNINYANVKGQTQLMLACSSPDFGSWIELLLKAGADYRKPDNDGNTALHYAAQELFGLNDIECLLKAGADPNALNKAGKTPLDLVTEALKSGKREAWEMDSLRKNSDILSQNMGEK
ncbi:MAG: ankyrin repeat domain-containing protein, partial [Candidatus Wallbacteria bacterium]|nr:ankyrin repeat domain-containing protein [Candidatus Wallbacteria bacterium]